MKQESNEQQATSGEIPGTIQLKEQRKENEQQPDRKCDNAGRV